jgi:hypothetical protein
MVLTSSVTAFSAQLIETREADKAIPVRAQLVAESLRGGAKAGSH